MIYIQFTAVVGALSLLSLLSDIVELQGVILLMVEWWANQVRPVVDVVFAPLVALLDWVFPIEVTIPLVMKDYLAVGMVLILSRWRGASGGWKGGATKATRSVFRKPLGAILLLLRTVFVWPFELLLLTGNMLFAQRRFPERSDDELMQIRISHFIALLPVMYAIVLVVLNWALALFPFLLGKRGVD